MKKIIIKDVQEASFKHRIQQQVLKRIRKEIYKREEKFCTNIKNPHDATIRAVALYRLEGLLSELHREFEDDKFRKIK